MDYNSRLDLSPCDVCVFGHVTAIRLSRFTSAFGSAAPFNLFSLHSPPPSELPRGGSECEPRLISQFGPYLQGGLYTLCWPGCGRLPGRPLWSPREHQSWRRGWAAAARPRSLDGPGAWLASGRPAAPGTAHMFDRLWNGAGQSGWTVSRALSFPLRLLYQLLTSACSVALRLLQWGPDTTLKAWEMTCWNVNISTGSSTLAVAFNRRSGNGAPLMPRHVNCMTCKIHF